MEGDNLTDGRRVFVNYGPNAISIKDLYSPDLKFGDDDNMESCGVEMTVLTTYVYRPDPLLEFLLDGSTPVTVFRNPYGKDTDACWDEVTHRIVQPDNRLGFGCYHPKLFLIKFKNGVLWVAITSSNLIYEDWYEIGQVIWLMDFHHKTEPNESEFEQ